MTGTSPKIRSPRWLLAVLGLALLAAVAIVLLRPRPQPAAPTAAAPTAPQSDLEQRAKQGSATPQELVRLGEQHLKQGEALKAAEMAFRARKADPNLAEAHRLLGVLYVAGQEPAKARAAFREAVRVAPNDLEPRLSLARFELDQRRPADALQQLQAALKIDSKNAELWVLAGRVQRALKSDNNAQASFEKAIRYDSQLAEAYFELGALHLDFDHYTEAVAPLQKAYDLGMRTPPLLSCYALALIAGPADDASAARADQLLTEAGRPEAPPSWFAQGLLLHRKREFPAARAAFEKVLKVNPTNERAQYALAMAYRDAGDLPAAQKAMARHDQLVRERQRKKVHTSTARPASP